MSRDALIVGINIYDELEILKSPAKDAEAIAELLRRYSDFNVKVFPMSIYRTDSSFKVAMDIRVTCAELKEELAQLFKPQGRSFPDTALFFFAGHGLREDKGIIEGYLATSDSDPDRGKWGVSLYWLRRLLLESPVRQQIIWLDCCYSGELLNFNDADPGDRGKNRDRCFIAASREYQKSYEISGGHGFLSGALAEGLDPTRQPSGIVDNSSLVAFIRQTWQNSLQTPIINNSGEQIILTSCDKSERKIIQPPYSICPYKGLNYFDCNDEDPKYFFGRTSLTDQLIEKVRAGNFLAVIGPSGSGKSSVVRAGLLHQLKQGQRLSGSEKWPILILRLGKYPMRNLSLAFVDQNLSYVEQAEQLEKAEKLISEGAFGLEHLISVIVGDEGRVVLFVDQFEEIFTLCRDNNERSRFFECLLGSLSFTENKLFIVIALRADFFGKCSEQEYAGLANSIQENLVTVKPMSSEEIKQAIIEPAKIVGLEVEQELITQMIEDVQDSPGCLPLLQYSLTELWKQRNQNHLTLNKYIQIGKVQGTLTKRADEIYENLLPEEKPIAKRIFIELTQLGEGTEDTRRQVFIRDLATSKCSQDLVNQVIQKLANAKLLVTDKVMVKETEGEHTAVVDLPHEALIRYWPRLRDWIDENRDDVRFQRRLDEAAKHWKRHNRSKGLLWRSPDLDLLKDFHNRFSSDMTKIQKDFFHASVQREKRIKALICFTGGLLLMLAIIASIAAIFTLRAGIIAERERYKSQSLLAKNYWINAINAKKNNEWFKATHFFAKAGKDENDSLKIKNCKLNIQILTRNLFLSSIPMQHDGPVIGAIFSKDEDLILTWSGDNTARLWHKDGTPSAQPMKHDAWIIGAAFSKDGDLILTWSDDGIARLWHMDGTPAAQPMKHDAWIIGAAFSKDGDLILTWSYDRTARLWHMDGTSAAQPMKHEHDGFIYSAIFSKDEDLILTWSGDTARLWHKDGTLAAQPMKHDGLLLRVPHSARMRTLF